MSRWNKEERLYNTTLYIKKNDIDRFDLIDFALSVETDNKKELCMKVLKYVENTDSVVHYIFDKTHLQRNWCTQHFLLQCLIKLSSNHL